MKAELGLNEWLGHNKSKGSEMAKQRSLSKDFIDGNNCAVRGTPIKKFRSKDAEDGYKEGLQDMLLFQEDRHGRYEKALENNNEWNPNN